MAEVVALPQYYEAAEVLEQVNGVRGVTVIEHDQRLDRPAIELTIGPAYERCPPRIHRKLGALDLGTRPDLGGLRGQPRHFVVVAT
jgi:hypothetical protein